MQMFPPNQFENSFDWFRNQHQLKDHYFNNGIFNRNEMNQYHYQYQHPMAGRYYGNMIQPYGQNQTVPVDESQSVQMMETSPFGTTTSFTNPIDEIHSESSTMFSNSTEYNQMQEVTQYPEGGYQNFSYIPHPELALHGYNQNGNMQNYSNYQMYANPYGQQYYSHHPNVTQGQMQAHGPFSTPAMFAPSTPYPTQPKQINQQNTNSQSSFQLSSILNQFKNTSGSYDVPKMMSTAGQVMNTVNQVGGLFKQIGFFFK